MFYFSICRIFFLFVLRFEKRVPKSIIMKLRVIEILYTIYIKTKKYKDEKCNQMFDKVPGEVLERVLESCRSKIPGTKTLNGIFFDNCFLLSKFFVFLELPTRK